MGVTTPEDNMGDVIGDINSRRGIVGQLDDKPGGIKQVNAEVPLSEMFNYVSRLRSMTKGRGNYSMKLEKYDVVPRSSPRGGARGGAPHGFFRGKAPQPPTASIHTIL